MTRACSVTDLSKCPLRAGPGGFLPRSGPLPEGPDQAGGGPGQADGLDLSAEGEGAFKRQRQGPDEASGVRQQSAVAPGKLSGMATYSFSFFLLFVQ